MVGELKFVYFRDPEGNIVEIQSWNELVHRTTRSGGIGKKFVIVLGSDQANNLIIIGKALERET